jgi:hypothetical protein
MEFSRLILTTLGLISACVHAGTQPNAQSAIEKAHAEIWRRFVGEHNVVIDYTDLDGSFRRPTPQDCREHKPSALSWGVPVEDLRSHALTVRATSAYS